MMEPGEIMYEKVFASPRPPPNLPGEVRNETENASLLPINWVQKLLEVVKTPNKPNRKPKIHL